RRRRYYWLRVLYAAFLALLLCWYFAVREREYRGKMSSQNAADLAEGFFYTFLLVQFIVLTLLTPAYTAGAVAEEKERRTLDFLLATDLRNSEIILSKLLARLANLSMLLLTGLPIVGLLQFLGGIDPNLVFAGFAGTGLTMLSLAAVSMVA